jgi:hypothetical protein
MNSTNHTLKDGILEQGRKGGCREGGGKGGEGDGGRDSMEEELQQGHCNCRCVPGKEQVRERDRRE